MKKGLGLDQNEVDEGGSIVDNGPSGEVLQSEELKALERRAFAKTLAVSAPAIVSSIAMWGVFIMSYFFDEPLKINDSEIDDSRADNSKKKEVEVPGYKYVNKYHALDNGAVLHNLGVLHLSEFFSESAQHILGAIDAADVLLLEQAALIDGEANKLRSGDYFSELAAYALRSGKEAFFIDPLASSAIAAITFASPTIAMPLITAYFLAKYKDLINPGKKKAWTRRALLTCFCEATTGVTASTVINITNPNDYNCYDFSITTDGRSLRMLDNSLEIAERFLGKRILIISGHNHARVIEYYLENPTVFEAKLAIYKATFGLLEGEQGKTTKIKFDS